MNTEIYKTININTDQSAILMTLIDQFIKKEKEHIKFCTERLNGSGSTQGVRECTEIIKVSKDRISQLANLQDDIINSELTTKHQLR